MAALVAYRNREKVLIVELVMKSGLESQCVVSIANFNNVVPASCEVARLFIQDVIAVCERVLQRSLVGYKVGELSTENVNAESE